MTKEHDGLVDSRFLQFFSSQPQSDQEPEHAIPLSVGRSIEYHHDNHLQFSLKIPAAPYQDADDEDTVYFFKARSSVQASAWVLALRDESNASERRMAAKSEDEVALLAMAGQWMHEVCSQHNPGKVQVRVAIQ
jgi:hypothetical protein